MPADPQSEGEIVTNRLLPWPREQVWAAISDPAALAAWWGPNGFTNTFQSFEFRPGGVWKFTMHGPDGAAYVMDHRFLEIAAPEHIVIRHLQAGHEFTLTIALAAQGACTALGWHMAFDDPAEAERVRAFVVPANEQNLDRLSACLSGKPPPVR